MQRYVYHIYIDLIGEETLFDFLDEYRTKKIADYPIWSLKSIENRDFFIKRLTEITGSIPVVNQGLEFIEPRWHILLMASDGYSGFSRGLTPEQYENLIESGQLKEEG